MRCWVQYDSLAIPFAVYLTKCEKINLINGKISLTCGIIFTYSRCSRHSADLCVVLQAPDDSRAASLEVARGFYLARRDTSDEPSII